MITLTTTIQEITMVGADKEVFNYLFNNHDYSRDEIFNLFEEWGREFEMNHKNHRWSGDYYEEIDEFVEKKFAEIKLIDEFVEGDYITYEEGLYKITGFTQSGIMVSEIRPRPNNDICPAIEFISLAQIAKISLVSGKGIMDCGNGHNYELVKRINDAWDKNMESFKPILCALYERDIDEITDGDSFKIPRWFPELSGGEDCTPEINVEYAHGEKTGDWTMFNELVLADMKREWDLFAENYLMHIADDQDLETILSFVRIEG